MACNLKETFPGARFWQLLSVGQEEFVFKRPLCEPLPAHCSQAHNRARTMHYEEILEITGSKQV